MTQVVTMIRNAVKSTALQPNERLLIMLDHAGRETPELRVGKFTHPYEWSDPADLVNLFESTFAALRPDPSGPVFGVGELPILAHIGLSRIPIVVRPLDGERTLLFDWERMDRADCMALE